MDKWERVQIGDNKWKEKTRYFWLPCPQAIWSMICAGFIPKLLSQKGCSLNSARIGIRIRFMCYIELELWLVGAQWRFGKLAVGLQTIESNWVKS